MPTKNRRVVAATAKETEHGLRELQKLQPGAAPGDFPGASSGLLHGRYALATWSGIDEFALILYDWEVSFEQEFADGTAHGDYWDNPVPIKMMWSGRASLYLPTGVKNTTALREDYLGMYRAGDANGDPAAYVFTGYTNTLAANNQIFAGQAYLSRVQYSAPRSGMFTQEISMRGVGAPSLGVQA